jgi:hypothetical protein
LTRGTAVAVGCISLYAALCLLPVAIVWNQPVQPRVPVTAHVVRIYARPSLARSGYLPDIVVVATDAGLPGGASVDYTKDRCQVGDLVDGWQQGINVDIDPRTCRRAPSELTDPT